LFGALFLTAIQQTGTAFLALSVNLPGRTIAVPKMELA
jgi:hypothetical protein